MNKVNFKGSVMLNPTPVVLITSINKEGKTNVFTVGWISTVCTKPPVIAVGIRPERLSYDYIKESEECVINLTTRDMVKITDYCGVISGKREDKIAKLGLELNSGVAIKTPSLEISPVALECKLKSITPLGTHDMFLLDVINVKVNESLLDEKGKIHFEKANLIAYSHGEYFGLDSEPLGSFGYSIRKNVNNKKQDSKKPNDKKSDSKKHNEKKSDSKKSTNKKSDGKKVKTKKTDSKKLDSKKKKRKVKK